MMVDVLAVDIEQGDFVAGVGKVMATEMPAGRLVVIGEKGKRRAFNPDTKVPVFRFHANAVAQAS